MCNNWLLPGMVDVLLKYCFCCMCVCGFFCREGVVVVWEQAGKRSKKGLIEGSAEMDSERNACFSQIMKGRSSILGKGSAVWSHKVCWWSQGSTHYPGVTWFISADEVPYGSPHLCRAVWSREWTIPSQRVVGAAKGLQRTTALCYGEQSDVWKSRLLGGSEGEAGFNWTLT